MKATDARKRLGSRIRSFRKAKKWSQEKLAREAEVGQAYISALERGQKNLTFDTVHSIAEAMDIGLVDLFDFADRINQLEKVNTDLAQFMQNHLPDDKKSQLSQIFHVKFRPPGPESIEHKHFSRNPSPQKSS